MPVTSPTIPPAQAQATSPAARKRRADCYVITLRVAIPLDMENSETLIAAIRAGEDARAPTSWPEGAAVEFNGRVGKMGA